MSVFVRMSVSFPKNRGKLWKLMNSTYFHHDCFHLNCLTNKVRTLETYHIASTHPLNLSEVLFSTHRVEELLQLIIGWYINIMVVCCFFCLFFFRVVALEDNSAV